MSEYTIYHNPRCSKSREALSYLENNQLKYRVVRYLDEALTFEDLQEVLDKLDIEAIELVRTNEKIWKEQFADKELDEDEIIFSMLEYPQLIQRPIIVLNDRAVIGRPTNQIEELRK
ncbi:MAG: arsenate reductase (glutaredoxin) [Flavobacteriales bacterium]|nr:MAG: arsenate reductase (glutaredoxin) [Flavobacteriales bacterium]